MDANLIQKWTEKIAASFKADRGGAGRSAKGIPERAVNYITAIFKKDFVIGLDIGAGSVKMVQFIKREDGLHLINGGVEDIAPSDNEILRQKEVLSSLGKLLRGIDAKKSKFIVLINCPRTAVKKVQTPCMPKGELRDGITLESKSYFPFSLAGAVLDFDITGEIAQKGIRKYELLVATSPKATVDKNLSLLKKTGIRPSSFIPVPLALAKLIENSGPEKEKTSAFLEIGQDFSELVIFKGNDLVLTRKIPVAGWNFTSAMTEALATEKGKIKLSIKEAEKIKWQIGIPSADESGLIDNKISAIQILSMIRTPMEQLRSEIDRCFDYYREESGDGKIDSLVLFGGGASLKGLSKYLSDELGIETKIGDSLEGLKVGPGAVIEKELSTRLASAIGAALSEARGINLLPVEIKEEMKRTFRRTTAEVIFTTVILVSIFVYIGMRIQQDNFQKRISTARMELFSLSPQLKDLKIQNLVKKILIKEPYWEDVLKDLSNIITHDIYLTEIGMVEGNVIMHGVVLSDEAETSLSDFILALEKGLFKNVKLVTTKEMKEARANEFKLECQVD